MQRGERHAAAIEALLGAACTEHAPGPRPEGVEVAGRYRLPELLDELDQRIEVRLLEEHDVARSERRRPAEDVLGEGVVGQNVVGESVVGDRWGHVGECLRAQVRQVGGQLAERQAAGGVDRPEGPQHGEHLGPVEEGARQAVRDLPGSQCTGDHVQLR